MPPPDLSRAIWRTSTRSGGNGNCVEVAANLPSVVAVRDTKDRTGPVLFFGHADWKAFTVRLGDAALDPLSRRRHQPLSELR
jgi:Domain of unknown function (DUF397)